MRLAFCEKTPGSWVWKRFREPKIAVPSALCRRERGSRRPPMGMWFGSGSSTHRAPVTSYGLVPPVSLSNPLPLGHPTTLADASAKLGTSIPMANTAEMPSSNVGSVWTEQLTGEQDTAVAVTYPSSGLIVQYQRPAPYSASAAPQLYQAMANEEPNSISVTSVNGIPAMAIKQNSDTTGTNLGSIEFVSGGTRIAVIGHYPQASLQAFGASVLAAAGAG
jgi:hypothetical protein